MTQLEEARLHITIQSSDSFGGELEKELDALDHAAYSIYAEDENDDIQWAESASWHVLGRINGKLVSKIGIVDRTILVGGQSLSIAGVGGVGTHPQFQRRGFAREMLKAAADEMRLRGSYDFAMLFCSSHMIPYYAKSGYCQIQNPIYILQRGQRVLFEDHQMVLPLSGKPWPEGEADLNGPPW
jgi:predicted acetyltransferase